MSQGKVWKYADNVDTDVIIPARYLNTASHEELAKHCMEDIDETFAKEVQKSDIIVARDGHDRSSTPHRGDGDGARARDGRGRSSNARRGHDDGDGALLLPDAPSPSLPALLPEIPFLP